MESVEPLISVIVPVYNGQEYLENCIKSIEMQTYGNLEIIIINDGSTDWTGIVCEKLQKDYSNVSVLTTHDEGVSAARNRGIDAAEGEFVTFVDADDRLRPRMLQILHECMMQTGSDVVGCKFFLWRTEEEWQQAHGGSAGEAENEREAAGRIETYTPDRYLREEVLCGNSRCWSKLYRREIIKKARFQENLSIGEDMLLVVGILPLVNTITETEYPGYGYFQNPAGAINREFTPAYMDQITCWQLVRSEILKMDPKLDAQVTALYMMAVMLTAGKLALLPAEGRRVHRQYIRVCHQCLREAVKVPGAYGKLPSGYRMKAGLFLVFPALYLCLYHIQKSIRGKR